MGATVIVLVGDREACLKRRAWYKAGFEKKYGLEGGIDALDAEEVPAAQIVDTLQARSLLGSKRMVILNGLPAATTGKKHMEPVEEFLKKQYEAIPEEVVVLCMQPQPDKRTGLYKHAKKMGWIEECLSPTGAVLESYIIKHSEGKCPMPVARYIAQQSEQTTESLDQILEKLRLYAGEKEWSNSMVDAVVQVQSAHKIFGLMDALSARKWKDSLRELQQLVEGGEEPIMVLTMCIRQMRLLYLVKAARDGQAMVTLLKVHPFVGKKLVQQSAFWNLSALEKAYKDFVAVDEGIKTGHIRLSGADGGEVRVAMERIMADVCAGRG